jgi:hypothetical protein
MRVQRFQSASELAANVAANPEFAAKIKFDPIRGIAGAAAPLQSDVWIYRLVVGSLGGTLLIVAIGAIALAFTITADPPKLLTAPGSAAVGALAGLFAPSPVSN